MHGGALWLTAASLWHGVSGFLIYVVAARLMPAAGFGTMTVVMAVALATEVVLIQGLPRGLAWMLPRMLTAGKAPSNAEQLTRARHLVRAMFLASHAMAAMLLLAYAAAMQPMTWMMGQPDLLPLLLLAGADFLAFAGYVIHLAVFNGLQRYRTQALVMMGYSTLKALAVLGLLAWQPAPGWGVAGYVLGSLLGTVLAGATWLLMKPLHPPGGDTPRSPVSPRVSVLPDVAQAWRFGLPMAGFAIAMAVWLNADLVVAKAILPPHLAGHYAGASQVARMVFFVFIAFGEALFPAVTKAMAQQQAALGAAQVQRSLGLLLVLALPAVALGMTLAAPTLALLFGAEYAAAAPALNTLVASAFILMLVQVLGAVLSAGGQPLLLVRVVAIGASTAVMASLLSGAVAGGTMSPETLGAWLGAIPGAIAGVIAAVLWRAIRLHMPTLRLPWRGLALAAPAAAALWLVAPLAAPGGWWLIPYGAASYAVAVGGALVVGRATSHNKS